jgi:Holliday junction DNA helicase RuvB
MIEDNNEKYLIRPASLEEFIGQEDIKQNLIIYVKAAKIQKLPLPHIMLSGGPGLGKTSCGLLCSYLMGSQLKIINGVSLQKATDITSILAAIKKNDIIFIDEIHRINKKIEEILYSAMEDFTLSLIIGEGSQGKIVKIKLPLFTLIGATTKYGMLSQPLRNRFGIHFRFNEYSIDNLQDILLNFCKKINIVIEEGAPKEIAIRGKKTPRIVINLTKRIIDFMYAKEEKTLTKELILFALNMMGIDNMGLEPIDLSYLALLINKKPMGLTTICAQLQETENTVEDTIEPYLLNINFIERTPKGRLITHKGIEHLKLHKANLLNKNI